MRPVVGSSQAGIDRPDRLAARAVPVATISGLRTSSRRKLLPLWRAIGHTAAMLHSGTHTPISTAIINSPCGPASRSASASATNELKRKATWALPAWSRRSTWRPSQGQYGTL